jgi:hypothetical protein
MYLVKWNVKEINMSIKGRHKWVAKVIATQVRLELSTNLECTSWTGKIPTNQEEDSRSKESIPGHVLFPLTWGYQLPCLG